MTGDFKWGIKSSGRLNWFNKVHFAIHAMLARKNNKEPGKLYFADPADFHLPDSTLIKQTIEFIKDTYQAFLLNHCYRTYIFGNIRGKNEKIKFDKELLGIASLLHDIGLTRRHQYKHPDCNCFAIEGALEAEIFLSTLPNIGKNKIQTIQDAISLHLNIKIPQTLPEAYLVNKGAATDVIGVQLKRYDVEDVTTIIQHYPRLGFKYEIHQVLKEQCKIRPQSRISFLYANGFGSMIKNANFEE
jgi:hypothetical protein